MAMEFFEGYCSNACFFENSVVTHIVGRTAIALCGALTNRLPPAYTIQNNYFYYPYFAVLTAPAQNLYVVGNQFSGTRATAALGLGCAGYQGSAINSNIVVSGNHFNGASFAVEIMGSGRNRTANVLTCSNTAVGLIRFAYGYGWSTNVCFRGNEATGGLGNGELKGQWFLDESNIFPPWTVNGSIGKTNTITYANGMRQKIWTSSANLIFALDDARPEKIPAGAKLQITFTGYYPATLYFSTTQNNPESVTKLHCNELTTYVWTNGGWEMAEGR